MLSLLVSAWVAGQGQALEMSYPVEPDQIKLEGPLKELGMYTVKLQLHPTIDSDVKVWVVPSASMAAGS